jgi:hypothetical protein
VKKKEQLFITFWEKQLEKGRWKYILATGLSWGTFMFVFMEIVNFFNEWRLETMTTGKYIFLFIYWLVGGLLFGLINWYFSNKRYNKLKRQLE